MENTSVIDVPKNTRVSEPTLLLGLPPSEPDWYRGPVQKPELYAVWLSLFWFSLVVIGTLVAVYMPGSVVAAIMAPPSTEFWDETLIFVPTMFLLCVGMGWLVENRGLNVAYTRKTGHIFANFVLPIMVVPPAIVGVDLFHSWYISAVWGSLFKFILPYLILIRPIRMKIYICYLSFRAYDRPEDRPYTMIWHITQLLAVTILLVPMSQYFAAKGMWPLFLIAACSVGLGDGLAEPIGRIYGKKKYKVKALFTRREYTRSYVGSACVAFFTVVGILFSANFLSVNELLILLAVLPITMVIVEAKSPHTWDNAFMYGACWLVIYLVVFA